MRWHTLLYFWLTATLLLLSANTAFAQNALNATVGTTGLGLEWASSLHPKLRVRGVLSYLTFEHDDTEEGIDYTIDFDSNNLGAILDWHPFAGSFRLSAGLVSTNFGLDFRSDSSQNNFEIGNSTYTGNLKLEGEADFNPIAPYAGFGWASDLSRSGLYFSGELGVLFIGKPKLSYDASGQARDQSGGPVFDVGSNPQFQADLEIERQLLEDEFEDISMWPVLNIGIGYRF